MLLEGGADINAVVSEVHLMSIHTLKLIILFTVAVVSWPLQHVEMVMQIMQVLKYIQNMLLPGCPTHKPCTVHSLNMKLIFLICFSFLRSQDVKSGRSPLVHAVENNCMELVHFLIEVWSYLCVFSCILEATSHDSGSLPSFLEHIRCWRAGC